MVNDNFVSLNFKLMMSQAVEGMWIHMGGSGANGLNILITKWIELGSLKKVSSLK